MLVNRFISALLVAALLLPAGVVAQKKPAKSSTKKPFAKQPARKPAKSPAVKAAEAARAKRMNRAFLASAGLRPMAEQLLQTRSKQAFAGVEQYANRHTGTDEGALAWLVAGYARLLDGDHRRAIAALKNSKSHARELGDYVDYFLATSYRRMNANQDVLIVLDGFGGKYPGSLHRRDAVLMHARALYDTGSKDLAIEVLEAGREPARADFELALGTMNADAGKPEKAIAAFRRVYYQMPMSAEADEAGGRLRELSFSPYGDIAMRKGRTGLLIQGRQYSQAVKELKELIKEAGDAPVAEYQVALAHALFKQKNFTESQAVLDGITNAQGEANAQRLYLLAEMSRNDGNDAAQSQYINELKASAPRSNWLQEALMSLGNKHLLRNDHLSAAAAYAEVGSRFPGGRFGPVAHWKSGWLQYRMGNVTAARQIFDRQIESFPASAEVPNALYWRGRVAELEGDLNKARSCYQKLSERYRNYYYAMMARDRLRQIKLAPVADDASFANIPPVPDPLRMLESSDGVTDLRLQKARLLANAAMFDQALKELESAGKEGQHWATVEMVKILQQAGRPHLALQTLKRTVPAYFAVELSTMPRDILETLFPLPYWTDLKASAAANSLDPFLVASLIRQESEFNPLAVSHANAYGLMQLLPSVGKKVAREIKLRPFSTSRLLHPQSNLRLGARYFRIMIDEHGGSVEYALAAYNAGAHRVSDWRASGTFKDMPEFVESIPFTETREYVQAIVRNVEVYRKLYGASPGLTD